MYIWFFYDGNIHDRVNSNLNTIRKSLSIQETFAIAALQTQVNTRTLMVLSHLLRVWHQGSSYSLTLWEHLDYFWPMRISICISCGRTRKASIGRWWLSCALPHPRLWHHGLPDLTAARGRFPNSNQQPRISRDLRQGVVLSLLHLLITDMSQTLTIGSVTGTVYACFCICSSLTGH